MEPGKSDIRELLLSIGSLSPDAKVDAITQAFAHLLVNKLQGDEEQIAALQERLSNMSLVFELAEKQFREFQSQFCTIKTETLKGNAESVVATPDLQKLPQAMRIIGGINEAVKDIAGTILLMHEFLQSTDTDAELRALLAEIKTPDNTNIRLKIDTIERDIESLTESISSINRLVTSFLKLLPKYQSDLKAQILGQIRPFRNKKRLLGKGLDYEQSEKVAVLIDKNPLLTQLLEDLMERLPHEIPQTKTGEEKEILEHEYVKSVTQIAQIPELDIIRKKRFITEPAGAALVDIFTIFAQIHEGIGKTMDMLTKARGKDGKVTERKRFQLPQKETKSELSNDEREMRDFYSTNFTEFAQQVKKIQSSEWVQEDEDLSVDEDCIGDHRLVAKRESLLRAILQLLDEIQSLKDDPKRLTNYLKKLVRLKKEYKQAEATIHKKNTNKSDTTHQTHYGFSHDEHGEIRGLKKIEISKPARVVGSLVNDVRGRINEYLEDSRHFDDVYNLFPGIQNSTRGNMIVLGPWGTGKTALIRELAADPEIITVEVSLGKLTSQWYGVLEKNIKNIFEYAQQKHKETGKMVYLLCDEFDTLFQVSDSSGGSQRIAVQKEIQQALDGVTAYNGVRLIGLSNVPHKIPIDIYRRAETVITQPITLDDKASLVNSRFDQFPCDDSVTGLLKDLQGFTPERNAQDYKSYSREKGDVAIHKIKHSELTKPNIAGETFFGSLANKYQITLDTATNLFYMSMATPRLLSVACEEAFRIAVKKFNELHPDKMKRLSIKAGKLRQSGKNTPEKTKKICKEAGFTITASDIIAGVEQAMKSKTAEKEIQANARFYEKLPEMMDKITGSAFVDENGVDETGERPAHKVEVIVKHVHANTTASGVELILPLGTDPTKN